MLIDNFKNKKQNGEPLVMCTVYDAWSARIVEPLQFDAVLVGDSVAMVNHGFENTLAATVEMMCFHVASVKRGLIATPIVADMPFMSYRKGLVEASRAAEALMKAGAHAVKLEGIKGHEDVITHLVQSGIPVMGHLGLTPQHYYSLGGYRVQGREMNAKEELIGQAKRLQELGCFSLVLECVPVSVAESITELLDIAVIGIGAGPSPDGQILVWHDILGLDASQKKPKFVREFLSGAELFQKALSEFKNSVTENQFPNLNESYI
jgi:3-methyl-2-oxobutanoate hydroxymethyltransferase